MSSKSDVIHNLTIRLPKSFPAALEEDRKLYEDQNGGITWMALFMILESYICKNYRELGVDQAGFWEWIEWKCNSSDPELVNAIGHFLWGMEDKGVAEYCRTFIPESLISPRKSTRKKRWFEQ